MPAVPRRSGMLLTITTNPSLMARTGRSADEVVAELCDVHPGPIFYQPVADLVLEREAEVRRIAALRRGRVVLKLPSTPDNFAMAARLAREGYVVAMTANFGPAQAYLAGQAGAE